MKENYSGLMRKKKNGKLFLTLSQPEKGWLTKAISLLIRLNFRNASSTCWSSLTSTNSSIETHLFIVDNLSWFFRIYVNDHTNVLVTKVVTQISCTTRGYSLKHISRKLFHPLLLGKLFVHSSAELILFKISYYS